MVNNCNILEFISGLAANYHPEALSFSGSQRNALHLSQGRGEASEFRSEAAELCPRP